MDQTLKENIKSPSLWLRVLFMLLLGFCAYVTFILLALSSIGQFFYVLIKGSPNPSVQLFTASAVEYFRQALLFITFNSDKKPFPFADWPEPDITTTKSDEPS